MSCDYCSHWTSKYQESKKDEPNDEGICARYPVHINTKRSHYCGEIVMHLGTRFNWSPEISPLSKQRNVISECRKEASDERNKRLALEKKLKSLRLKIKNQTVKKTEALKDEVVL